MRLADSLTTFEDLAREGLEISVTCPNCGHKRLMNGDDPRVRDRRVSGARFRCQQCGCVGLPAIGKQRRWARTLADHARRLKPK